jgi:hypothetical protein
MIRQYEQQWLGVILDYDEDDDTVPQIVSHLFGREDAADEESGMTIAEALALRSVLDEVIQKASATILRNHFG